MTVSPALKPGQEKMLHAVVALPLQSPMGFSVKPGQEVMLHAVVAPPPPKGTKMKCEERDLWLK